MRTLEPKRHVHRWTQFGDRPLWQCDCGKTKKSPPVDYGEVAKRRKAGRDARKKRELNGAAYVRELRLRFFDAIGG